MERQPPLATESWSKCWFVWNDSVEGFSFQGGSVKQELAAETSGHESNGGVMEIKCIIFIKCLELAINASTCYME